MKAVLLFAVSGMLALLIGIFMLVLGNLTSNLPETYAGVFFIVFGLSSIGWSVVARNKNL